MTEIANLDTKSQPQNYNWQKVFWPNDLADYKKIYLESLEERDLLNFYLGFNGRLKIMVLNSANLDEAIRGEDSLLIYATNDFSAGNKLSVRELWNKLFAKKIDTLLKFCYITSPLLVTESESTCKLIRAFDDGAFSVVVVDKEKNFVGTITRESFRRNFPAKTFDLQRNLFLNAEQDVEKIKRSMAEKFFETNVRELPIIQDGKVLSSCKVGKTLLLQNCEEKFPPVYWDAVSDDVAKDFLEGKRRILISSACGVLKGFRERFRAFADVSVYDDTAENILNEDFDFLVYGADVWENFPAIKFNAQKLYANLLAEDIRRYLSKSGVKYFYLKTTEKFQRENKYRTKYSQRMTTAPLTFGNPEEDYLIHSDKFDQSWNTVGGIRMIPDVPQNFRQRIFFFGACSAVGTFVDDKHTIAAFLQARFNKNSVACKVVNCSNNGGFSGATINELYRMADTCFRVNDIVVHINSDAWCYAFAENVPVKFSFDDIFNCSGNKFSHPFRDTKSAHHLNEKGNELIADFLFRKLKTFLPSQSGMSENVMSFFSVTPIADRLSKNLQLKNFLAMLAKEKVPVKTAGAVVMNCNPFTLGHRYLIEQARQKVDFLYVFVVEEDLSEFSFCDRISLAKAACADFTDVKILSAGKFMISLITFADYFQKDALQGRTVTAPLADIKLFGQVIAPLLNIKKRFVGTEPFDLLTEKYNQAMRELLPNFGVELIETPRCMKDGEIISASTVRDLIKRNKPNECKKFLPASTWSFIQENFFS